jgi:hypothetical protein
MTINHVQTINLDDATEAARAFAAAGAAFGGLAPRHLGEIIEAAGPEIIGIDMPMLAEAANAAALSEAQQENAGASGYWPAPGDIDIEHQLFVESTQSWETADQSAETRTVLRYGWGRSVVMWVMTPGVHMDDRHALVFGVRAESVDSGPVGLATVDEWVSALESVQQRIDAARSTWATDESQFEPMADGHTNSADAAADL